MIASMKYRKVSPDLIQGVVQHEQHVWQRQNGFSDNAVFAELPVHLRNELAVHLSADMVSKIVLFQDCDRSFVRLVAVKLRPSLSARAGSEPRCT